MPRMFALFSCLTLALACAGGAPSEPAPEPPLPVSTAPTEPAPAPAAPATAPATAPGRAPASAPGQMLGLRALKGVYEGFCGYHHSANGTPLFFEDAGAGGLYVNLGGEDLWIKTVNGPGSNYRDENGSLFVHIDKNGTKGKVEVTVGGGSETLQTKVKMLPCA